MQRLNIFFALIIASSATLALVAGIDAWKGTVDPLEETIDSIQGNVSVTLVGARQTNESLNVSLRITNPTDHPITLTGAYIRVKNETDVSIAAGPATHRVVHGSSLQFRGSLSVSYEIRLSKEETRALRAAQSSGGFILTGRQSFEHRNESFVVHIPETEVV